MRKSNKIWLGLGAFVLASGHQDADAAMGISARMASGDSVSVKAIATAADAKLWLTAGGEGGEGGEGGVDAADAQNDPVAYSIGLGIIEAHLRAGLEAYRNGEKAAGAEMFAHGYAEAFAPLEAVFVSKGAGAIGGQLTALVEAANGHPDAAKIEPAVQAVLSAVETARPEISVKASNTAAQVAILIEFLDRASRQYGEVLKDTSLEPYLDGLGFTLVAEAQAARALPLLKDQPELARALGDALAVAKSVYAGGARPASFAVGRADFLSAVSVAKLAASRIG
jgi:hypothetical protein